MLENLDYKKAPLNERLKGTYTNDPLTAYLGCEAVQREMWEEERRLAAEAGEGPEAPAPPRPTAAGDVTPHTHYIVWKG